MARVAGSSLRNRRVVISGEFSILALEFLRCARIRGKFSVKSRLGGCFETELGTFGSGVVRESRGGSRAPLWEGGRGISRPTR